MLSLALVLWSLTAGPQDVIPLNPERARALGSARYAGHEYGAALEVWNAIGEPRISQIRVLDAHRTRETVVTRLVGLTTGDVLTKSRYDRAVRRLVEFPAGSATMTYVPDGNGQVDVDITLDESPLTPANLYGLGALGAEALFLENIIVPVSNPLHDGEVWTASFRWPSEWRLYSLDMAAPAPSGLPGVVDALGSWERQTYGPSPTDTLALHTEDHTKTALALDDWFRGRLRWRAGASFDRWNDRQHVGVVGSLDIRLAGDRISVGTDDAKWFADSQEGGFSRRDAWMAWRTTPRPERAVLMLLVEGSTASVNAPLDLWNGAGSGLARSPLLRAHEEINDNVIDGPIFGRTLFHATSEYQHPFHEVGATTLKWAAFVDTARAWHRFDGSNSSLPVDAGVGVRWAAPGIGSTVRLDVAHGLRDGGWALSFNWQAPWPRQ